MTTCDVEDRDHDFGGADSAAATKGAVYCDGPDAWQPGAGTCGWRDCGSPLLGRSSWFCSSRCAKQWRINHQWKEARAAAIKRAHGTCSRRDVGCLQTRGLEVNHIRALADMTFERGRATPYQTGCQHHAENLEVLCGPHHQETTNAQAAARRERTEAKA